MSDVTADTVGAPALLAMDGAEATSGVRIAAMDAVRGFAVLGILIRNILVFGIPTSAYAVPELWSGPGAFHLYSWMFVDGLVDGSMRALFSMLFGASALLLLAKPSLTAAADNVELFYRRAMWLMAFGLVHAYLLLSPVDVLFIYGLFGLMIYPLRNVRPRNLLIVAATGMVLSAGLAFAILNLQLEGTNTQADLAAGVTVAGIKGNHDGLRAWSLAASNQDETQSTTDSINESWSSEVADRQEGYLFNMITLSESSFDNHTVELFKTHLVDIGAFILIGMAFFKLGILTGARSTRFYVVMAVLGYAIGLATNVAEIAAQMLELQGGGVSSDWTTVTYDLGRSGVAFGHLAIIILLLRVNSLSLFAEMLKAAGRLALSNYVLQTVICTILFFGHGFALYGLFGHGELLLIGTAMCVCQLVGSWLYLKVFAQGPLEMLLRRLVSWRGSGPAAPARAVGRL